MDRFLNRVIVEISRGAIRSRPYVLEHDLSYVTECIPGVEEIVVPLGFRSDLASIPRLFWRIFPPGGPYRRAAVVHDWLCVLGEQGNAPCSSKQAADVFLEAMVNDDVPPVTRWLCYKAVLHFGPKWK